MNLIKRILVVDDEPDLLKSLSYRMKKSGYEVIEAASGEEGLDKAAKHSPDLILLDWRLPGLSGTEVYRRLKANPDLSHIPVLFLTASRELADLESLKKEIGEASVMIKPYDYNDLLARIKELAGA